MQNFSFFIILTGFILIFGPIKCFDFSVIIAIYNTGKYLSDSIGSLLNQTIGYQKIQIILVNDGSNDNSEEICLSLQKKYKENIIYIKIGHGGVSRARNEGLKYAKGNYINFLDADDKWDSKAFKYASLFFNNYKNVNIIAGRIKFFELMNSYHPLDYKFYKTRVANLTKEYNCIHISGPSSFFRKSIIKGKKFDENIFSGEDTIFINNLLLLNPIIGYIREAIYYYRKRSDFSSAVQNQVKKIDFYFSQIKYVGQYLLDKSKELYNRAIPFIQFYIGYNILFRIISPAFKFLNNSDFKEYCNIIEGQLKQIDDKYILEQRFTSYSTKIFALSKKYNRDLRNDVVFKNESFIYFGINLLNIKNSNNIIIWRILELKNNILHLEGKDNLWMPKEKYFYYCKTEDKTFFPKYHDFSGYNFYTMYGLENKGRVIIFDIPIVDKEKQIISFFISYNNIDIEIFPSLGIFTHIPSLESGYYSNGKYIIKRIEKRLNIYKYNKYLEKSFETQYCLELKSISKEKIIKLRKKALYRNSNKLKKNKEIWLINDKQDRAGDNGEYFFRYLMEKNLKDIEIYFIIKKNCDDYERLKIFGNILDLDSNEYLIKFLNSDKVITSVPDSWATNPFGTEQKYIRDLYHFKIIFIQNGIIKDDLSIYLNRINKNFDLFITTSKKEYKYILSSKYDYNKNIVKLTGLSRFDFFLEQKGTEKLILLIPSWRSYIRGTRDIITYKPIHSDTFKNSTFYYFYNNLINDQKLLLNMKKYNYTGVFCLHPNFSGQKEDFLDNDYFTIEIQCNYSALIKKASLLMTDYSSIFFDFAYLKKPIIYSHFDIEEFRTFQYPEGYFDYEKDGFGPICKTIDCTVDELVNQIINKCKIKKKYFKRILSFFTFSDRKNNDRLFDEIKKKKIKVNKINILEVIYILLIIFSSLFKLKMLM